MEQWQRCQLNYNPVSVKRLGVLDTFGESARDDEIGSLFEKYGLRRNENSRDGRLV